MGDAKLQACCSVNLWQGSTLVVMSVLAVFGSRLAYFVFGRGAFCRAVFGHGP
jgi:hypothetical protein